MIAHYGIDHDLFVLIVDGRTYDWFDAHDAAAVMAEKLTREGHEVRVLRNSRPKLRDEQSP